MGFELRGHFFNGFSHSAVVNLDFLIKRDISTIYVAEDQTNSAQSTVVVAAPFTKSYKF